MRHSSLGYGLRFYPSFSERCPNSDLCDDDYGRYFHLRDFCLGMGIALRLCTYMVLFVPLRVFLRCLRLCFISGQDLLNAIHTVVAKPKRDAIARIFPSEDGGKKPLEN